ncbi:MAG: hypothetical protein KKF02_13730 [Proteobacteria bacterium]|nr:hypothetical protein [Pseudomonadota bacterium]
MGLTDWLARKGNVGGTARAVAKGWRSIKEQNPEKSVRDVAEAYIDFRYSLTGEPQLAEEVFAALPYNVNPLILSWTIFKVENKRDSRGDRDEIAIVVDHMFQWQQIMREEIKKFGIEPE